MFGKIAKAVFGSSNDRYVKSLDKIVQQINAFEPTLVAMSDEELSGQTLRFRERLAGGEDLDDLLPEAFARVREASSRVLGMRLFDVQMIGGIVLHRGEIAEMKTGEGKTLVATLAVYLNALEGKGVHVVTVNDYLARRDADWMGQIYNFLGMTYGVIVPNLSEEERRAAYNSDITYATNNELGFDYLRDNMKQERSQMVHRPFNHAIVDEVDSILIDEARTPLIISGPTDDKTDLYVSVDAVVKQIVPEDYDADEKSKSITLTEDGVERVERLLEEAGLLVGSNLYDIENTQVVHHLDQSLKANVMFKRDTDYIVKDDKVIIIDEFTGRMMDGRLGAVTIATNMAGRGTDIKLGGNLEFLVNDELKDMPEGPERDAAIERIKGQIEAEKQAVLDAGGLFVLGTERHESRRIDNQLRGRSGRQGDPGLSRFYLCLEDDLLRIFGPDTLFSRMMNSNLADGEAIGSKWLSKAIETAQKKVEARNYDVRKQVVEYDDVMNDQRKVIYEQRADIMDADKVDDVVIDMRHDTVNTLVGDACPPGSYPEQWNLDGLRERAMDVLGVEVPVDEWLAEDGLEPDTITERLIVLADDKVEKLRAGNDPEIWHHVEKSVLLERLDHYWKEHLATLDALRQVVFLRAYAQKTPINEYKQEAFGLFERMLEVIREDVTRILSNSELSMQPPADLSLPELPDFLTGHIDPFTGEDGSHVATPGAMAMMGALGSDVAVAGADPYADLGLSRNAQCPCGSGKKYKHCHGAMA